MPTYLVTVTERRTYQIEAEAEAAAIERACGEPDELPIGALVSAVRSHPVTVRPESTGTDGDVSSHGPHPGRPVVDADQILLNQRWV